MLSTKFRFIWSSGFREDFLNSANQKQEFPVAAMFINGSGQNIQSLERTFHRCFLPSFSTNGFRGEESKKSANQKQELLVAAMFVNGSGQNEQSL